MTRGQIQSLIDVFLYLIHEISAQDIYVLRAMSRIVSDISNHYKSAIEAQAFFTASMPALPQKKKKKRHDDAINKEKNDC